MLEPEEEIASRLTGRWQLAPPIPVDWLVAKFADVEEDDLPVSADAITLGLKSGDRPRIIVEKSRADVRRRFTLSHELGHIVIPWHVGTMVISHIAGYESFDDFVYRSMETEANRFASELLIPSAWLAPLVAAPDPVDELHKRVAGTAEVSVVAAAFSLIRALPPGYAFVELEDGTVKRFGQSPGTSVPQYEAGSSLQPSSAFGLATYRQSVPTPSKTEVIWGVFHGSDSPLAADDSREWREALRCILDELLLGTSEADSAYKSINGIVGYAHGRLKGGSYEQMLAFLRQRFSNRPNLATIVAHRDFELFLALRARALTGR